MPKAASKSNSRRSRSFGGCGTCRRRHVKCDQVRPECLTCKAVGVTCEGFSAEIRWISARNEDTKSKEPQSTVSGVSRRHLYSESDREKMSSSLAAAFPIGTVDASLAALDTKSKGRSASSEVMGPFGVINFNDPTEAAADPYKSDPDCIIVGDHAPEPSEENISPLIGDSWTGLDETLQWADLFALNADDSFPPFDNSYDPLLDLQSDIPTVSLQRHNEDDDTMPCDDRSVILDPRIEPSPHIPDDEILNESQVLLKHFRRDVISRFSCLPITNTSPWNSIMFTEAVNTLAHLTFLGTIKVTSARRANLFIVLAISAYHLARNPSNDEKLVRGPGEWDKIAEASMHEAKQSLQRSLKSELQGPSKAKYKDQLMSILGLLALAAMTGRQDDARCYLIDAERLMRYRGLAKREMSRKARLLHHVYTWSRIIGESCYVLHEYGDSPAGVSTRAIVRTRPFDATQHTLIPPSGPGSRLDDFLRLEPHHSDSDLEIEHIKEPQTSLRDIHLADSRENPDTMYTQIYGISETWLSLLSQTTRLANHLDGYKAAKIDDPVLSDLLQRRSNRLEDMICSFTDRFEPKSMALKWAPNNHMHQALNSALVIFFYRRIKNVNSLILQSHVDDVISALERFDQSLSEKTWEGPGSPWAAFMAGCEAGLPEKRETILKWIEKGTAMTGFDCYENAKKLLLEVWARKDKKQSNRTLAIQLGSIPRQRTQPTSWVEICREQQLWLMAF